MHDRVALVTAVSVKVDSGTACNVELTRGECMAHYGNTHVWRGYGLAETPAAMADAITRREILYRKEKWRRALASVGTLFDATVPVPARAWRLQ